MGGRTGGGCRWGGWEGGSKVGTGDADPLIHPAGAAAPARHVVEVTVRGGALDEELYEVRAVWQEHLPPATAK